MTASDAYAVSGRAPSSDPFTTRDGLLGWMQDIAPHGLFTTDADLVVRSWNQWLATHSGLAPDAVIGRSLLEVFPDVPARKLDAHYTRALQGEVSVLSTALHKYLLPLTPAVRTFHAPFMLQTARIAPLPAGDAIVGTITIIEDVTQRECQAIILRRQQALDRLLSDAMASLLQSEQPLAIVAGLYARLAIPLKLEVFFHYVFSPDGSELRLHAAGGVSPEVRATLALLAPADHFLARCALRRLPLIESHVQQSAGEHAETARRIGLRSYAGFPLVVGDRMLGILVFGSYDRDIIASEDSDFLTRIAQQVAIAIERAQREHDLRDAQMRLSVHAGELEAKVAQRTARLQDTIAQLESFSYTIAHDLRAPIRSLMGFTEILLADFADTVPPAGQDLMRRLHQASHRLDALTRDLLKFSRLVREDVVLAPVELDELVRELITEFPKSVPVEFSVREPLGVVWAQRTLLQQCLANLFDNAVKFAKPGTECHIVVRAEARVAAEPAPAGLSAPFHPPSKGTPPAAGPRRRIWVEDNGIGIPRTAHQKVFGIFERIPGVTPVEGTGIGLAIVARATEQMGGTCGVESVPGEGSRFWLEYAAIRPAPDIPSASGTKVAAAN